MAKPRKQTQNEQLLLNEVQLLLAEKRTYLSMLRTGLAVFTVPITIIAVLAATVEYHGLFSNVLVGLVITGAMIALSLIGLSIFYQAQGKIKRLDRMIRLIEKESKRIAEILI
jgi:uncharacterized membrane protein YidH (DUF202 family)